MSAVQSWIDPFAVPESAWDRRHPFRMHGPTLISFSGGRTSALMLYLILREHGGTLPEDCYVVFANTGREREETLRFIYECGIRWGVDIVWLEWRPFPRGAPLDERFEVVGLNSADRSGHWFAELIRRKQYLPNPVMRYCTTELKIRVMRDFMLSQGLPFWINCVGIRADEPERVMKGIDRNMAGKERYFSVHPLYHAGIELPTVRQFWREQPFDLQLMSHEGNCDLCFLKGRPKKMAIMRQFPELADWWIEQERSAKCSVPDGPAGGARFRAEETIAAMRDAALNSPLLPTDFTEEDEFDADCGVSCPGEDYQDSEGRYSYFEQMLAGSTAGEDEDLDDLIGQAIFKRRLRQLREDALTASQIGMDFGGVPA